MASEYWDEATREAARWGEVIVVRGEGSGFELALVALDEEAEDPLADACLRADFG